MAITKSGNEKRPGERIILGAIVLKPKAKGHVAYFKTAANSLDDFERRGIARMKTFYLVIALLLQIQFAISGSPNITLTTCSKIKAADPKAESGVYTIRLPSGFHKVYCEMAINGGGYTFLRHDSLSRLTKAGMSLLFTKPRNVLLRISNPNGAQPYTVIRQYTNTGGLSVQISSYIGYTQPSNHHLGPYIFLGTLPAASARNNNMQGFYSNDKSVAFRNCDKNPNAYFAFFSNPKENAPSSYLTSDNIFERQGVAVKWRGTARRPYSGRRMPLDYFLFTELFFGGCGCYTSSDRWLTANNPAVGTAIGIR
eukprot:gene10118-11152_t